MKIMCISGKAEHGKDTAAKIMKDFFEEWGKSVLLIHYADLVKFVAEKFFDWNGKKDEGGRGLLQKIGTDVVRVQNPDYWVGFIAQMLKFFPDEWDWVLIPDCRFPNEIEVLKQAGFEVEHVRVVRDGYENHLTEEQRNHPSETALDDYPCDYLIHNTSMESLQEQTWGVATDELVAVASKNLF